MANFKRYPLKKLFQLDEKLNKKLEKEAREKGESQGAILRRLIDMIGG